MDNAFFIKDKMWIDFLIKSLFKGDENFELTSKGNIEKYLDADV